MLKYNVIYGVVIITIQSYFYKISGKKAFFAYIQAHNLRINLVDHII